MKKIKLIALLAALLVGLGVYMFLKEIGKPAETPRTAVVLAAQDIPENTKITEEMLVLQAVATEALLPNALRDPSNVIGMVSSGSIYAGEQIVSDRLVRVGSEAVESKTLTYKLDDGMRAVTVAVSGTTGVANLVKPGNRVDVIMNYTYEQEIEKEKTGAAAAESGTDAEEEEPETRSIPASRLLLQNLKVLAVDAAMSKEGKEEAYATVTLEATPEEAVTLSFAEFTSSLRLILRPTLDQEHTDEIEIDLDTIRGTGEEAKAP